MIGKKWERPGRGNSPQETGPYMGADLPGKEPGSAQAGFHLVYGSFSLLLYRDEW
jgi:hypothetical protein